MTWTKPFYGHYTRQSVLAGAPSQELEDFAGAKICCLYTLADHCYTANMKLTIKLEQR